MGVCGKDGTPTLGWVDWACEEVCGGSWGSVEGWNGGCFCTGMGGLGGGKRKGLSKRWVKGVERVNG